MRVSNNDIIKKSKKSKDKQIVLTNLDKNTVCLLYYDNGLIKKSKIFIYPMLCTNSEKSKVDRLVNKEYKLWLHCLWHYGYLEEDDVQLLEYQTLDKNNK